MLKLKMFTVYDSKAETYLRPFSMQSTGEAIRGFITTLNDGQSDLSLYPADFTLFELAEFDVMSGSITTLNSMINLGNGLHLKTQGQPKIPSHIHAQLGNDAQNANL